MFENGLEEFDDARSVISDCNNPCTEISLVRATVEEVLNEYKACESPDYITYVRKESPFG